LATVNFSIFKQKFKRPDSQFTLQNFLSPDLQFEVSSCNASAKIQNDLQKQVQHLEKDNAEKDILIQVLIKHNLSWFKFIDFYRELLPY
jgi:hypothetical protein